MAFTDLNFISRFLPLFITIYFLVPKRLQMMVLFGGSILFYACGDLRALPLLLSLCGLNYTLASFGYKKGKEGYNKWLFLAIISTDVLVLVIIKILVIIVGFKLPLGISFYIFKMLSFQADLYTGKLTFYTGQFIKASDAPK